MSILTMLTLIVHLLAISGEASKSTTQNTMLAKASKSNTYSLFANASSKSKVSKKYQPGYNNDHIFASKSPKAKLGKSKSGKKSYAEADIISWAPNNSFYGTYITDANVTFVTDIDSITISYECIEKYKDLPPYVYIVLPIVTQALQLSSSQTLEHGSLSAVTYDNSTNVTNREYARFDFITVETILYYCEGDYKEDSIEGAILNDAATYNLTAGCNGYPWSKLFRNDYDSC